MRPGDYPVLYEEMFEEVIAKIEQGQTIEKAMNGSGHNSRTFYNWLKNRPAWKDRYAEARQVHAQVNADRVDSRVEELVMKDDPAPSTVALWAKRHNPAYREKLEVSGEGGGPIKVMAQESPFSQLSKEDLEALVIAARTKQIADAEVIDAESDEG